MGPIKEWPKFLKVFADKGYNMIHFTPLNHRGDSNSPYSIFDQLAFSPDLFDDKTSKEQQYREISKVTEMMEKDFGLLSLIDVVWNHTAENSDWLLDHPEAAYNLHNSPHLIAPYELDSALLDFSRNLRHFGYPTIINDNGDLLRVMEGIKTHVLGSLRLWEFFVIEVNPTVSAILSSWKKGKADAKVFDGVNFSAMPLPEKAKVLVAKGLEGGETLGQRFQKTINPGVGAAYLTTIYGAYSESNLTAAQNDITSLINEVNLPFYKEFDNDREAILENTYNRVKYVRLDLKKGEINEE
jgi:glycogen debranching enzyme